MGPNGEKRVLRVDVERVEVVGLRRKRALIVRWISGILVGEDRRSGEKECWGICASVVLWVVTVCASLSCSLLTSSFRASSLSCLLRMPSSANRRTSLSSRSSSSSSRARFVPPARSRPSSSSFIFRLFPLKRSSCLFFRSRASRALSYRARIEASLKIS